MTDLMQRAARNELREKPDLFDRVLFSQQMMIRSLDRHIENLDRAARIARGEDVSE